MKKIRTSSQAVARQHLPHQTRHAFPIVAIAACGFAAFGHIGAVEALPAVDALGKAMTGRSALAESSAIAPRCLSDRGQPSAPACELLRVAQVGTDFMVMDVSGKEGEPLLLKIVLPPNPTATYSFLMFQGLPPKFGLSAGFATKNQWAVSLNDLGGLRLVPPPDYTGSFSLDVLLVKGKDIEPERRTMKVEFTASTDSTASTANFASQVLTSGRQGSDLDVLPSQTIAKKAPAPQPMDDEDRLMVERGDALFKQGDVSAARLIYHRMAKKGIATAALAMARTYDPDVLKTLKVEGLLPDVAQARVWYKMAEELGSSQAKSRLLTLREGN